MTKVILCPEKTIRPCEVVAYNPIVAVWQHKKFLMVYDYEGIASFRSIASVLNTLCGSCRGISHLIEAAINMGAEVYQFDSWLEFAEWALK